MQNNLIQVTGVKPGQRAILVDNKAILVGLGGKQAPGSLQQDIDLSFITATKDQILEGYTGANQSGGSVRGTMPNNTLQPYLKSLNSVTIPKGYNPGAVVDITPDLSFVTASSSLILAGYVGADTNGSPVNGSILYKYSSDVILNQEGSISIPKGYYLNAEVTLPLSTTAVDSNLVTTTIGWSKGLTTTVGTLIEGGLIYPTTTDQTIAKNSFLASNIVVKGLQNFTLLNIAEGVTMWGKTGTHKGNNSSGGFLIYQIKKYIAPNSIVQSYQISLDSSVHGTMADAMNGTYVRKTKEGYYDRYINAEKRKVLIVECTIDGAAAEAPVANGGGWCIVELKDNDSYTSSELFYTEYFGYADDGSLNNATGVKVWRFRKEDRSYTLYYKTNENYPISVKEWIPETIIANKVLSYSGDTPTVDTAETSLRGKQYSVEVGKSYVVLNNIAVGHPCFMPDVRVTYIMSGMDDYDANANGIYTQNDFFAAGNYRTWSNENGYTIKYDYFMYQWGCYNGDTMVAQGGSDGNPLGAGWYLSILWSGTLITLQLYNIN